MKKLSLCPSELSAQELDKFRRLKGYCEHDLKSAVGIIKGFLQILVDEGTDQLSDQHQEFLKKALNGAESALLGIEQNLSNNMPQFKTLWWLADGTPQGQPPKDMPLLYLQMSEIKDWEAARESYRPSFFFVEEELVGEKLQDIVQKTGPFFSEIYLIGKKEKSQELANKLGLKGVVSPSSHWDDLAPLIFK